MVPRFTVYQPNRPSGRSHRDGSRGQRSWHRLRAPTEAYVNQLLALGSRYVEDKKGIVGMAGHGQDFVPTPRSWLEKAYDANLGIFFSIFFFITWFNSLRETLGSLAAFAIVVMAGIVSLLLLRLLVAPMKKRRKALDTAKGLIECALREKDATSYKGKWTRGYVKAETGQLEFQARTGITGPPIGPIDTYSEVREVGEPKKVPWSVLPRGTMITLDTNQGTVELATKTSGLDLLTKQFRTSEI